jgi:death-on-curing protein
LDSALSKPRNHYHYSGEEDVLVLAVTMMAGIVQNHRFEQGKKRTDFLAA